METLLDLYRDGGWRRVLREAALTLLTIGVVVVLAAVPLTIRCFAYLPALP